MSIHLQDAVPSVLKQLELYLLLAFNYMCDMVLLAY